MSCWPRYLLWLIITTLGCINLLSACGQKGPLYLPDQEQQETSRPRLVPMKLHFTKMQGLGNDFVVFDAINQTIRLDQAQYRLIADRHFGIGCDQILLIERPRLADTDFHYRIFNADGSEVEQCGNGARCFARFVSDKGLTGKQRIPVGTAAGRIVLQLEHNGQVTVDMGVPVLEPASIPFHAPARALTYPLQLPHETLTISAVSMGNPHAILQVDAVESADVARLGPLIENHPDFPKRVNAGFMQRLDPEQNQTACL